MSLIIKGGNSSIRINHVKFDETSNSFLCLEVEDQEPIFSIELPFQGSEVNKLNDDTYTEKIHLFINEIYENKKVIKLKLKEKPEKNKLVGYIFSLRDLMDSPEIFDNDHLKKIVYNILKNLLSDKNISISPNEVEYRTNSDYKLFDFYNENLIIVAICDQFVGFDDYNFKNYLPSFSKYGFKFSHQNEFYSRETDCSVIKDNFKNIDAAITLNVPVNDLHQNYFIMSLIQNELISSNNEVTRFHILYQVIEMLMEKVYLNEVKSKLIAKFNNLSSFDAKELMRESMRDSYSLEKLFSQSYTNLSAAIIDEIKSSIDIFLTYISFQSNNNDAHNKIYKVRNTLFHGYSKILENQHLDRDRINNYLKAVNDCFEYLISEIILTYKNPT